MIYHPKMCAITLADLSVGIMAGVNPWTVNLNSNYGQVIFSRVYFPAIIIGI